jgi:hypothetical protein
MAVPIMLIIVIERGVERTRTKRRVREDEKDIWREGSPIKRGNRRKR